MLRLFNVLKLSPATKTAFDSADVAIAIQNGESLLDPIKLTGNAFSLLGRGKLDVQGDLDLRLKVILGRDRIRVPIVSDVLREASGQIFAIRVRGTPAYPKFTLEPLPTLSEIPKSLNNLPRPPRAALERLATPACGMTDVPGTRCGPDLWIDLLAGLRVPLTVSDERPRRNDRSGVDAAVAGGECPSRACRARSGRSCGRGGGPSGRAWSRGGRSRGRRG